MNQSSQLDRHPDAESLSAFAEHALPAQEHKQLLSHLAECSRCRQIVYLAQESAEEIEAPQPVQIPRRRYSSPWFAKWRFVWVPAAVCVALAVARIQFGFMSGRPASGDFVIVESGKSGPTGSVGSATAPTPAARRNDEPRQASVAAKPSLDASKSTISPQNSPQPPRAPVIENLVVRAAPAEELKKKESAGAAPVSGMQNASGQADSGALTATTVDVQSAAPLLTQESPISGTLSAAKVQSMPLTGRNVAAHPKATFAKAGTVARRKAVAAPQPVVISGANTTNTLQTAGPPSHFTVSKSPPPVTKGLGQSAANFSVSAPAISAADEFAARSILFSRLPNGLTAISTAAAHGHLLAIDPTGAVFLSEDYGKTWISVDQTWKGQAVQLRVPQTPAASSVGSFVASQAPAPVDAAVCSTCSSETRSAPAPVFEMVTKTGSVWSSTDGKTWIPKAP